MHKQRFPCKIAELLRHARPESAPAPRRKYNDSRFLHIHFQKIELMSSDWLYCHFANLLKILFQCQNSVVKTVSGVRQDTDLAVTGYTGACGGVRGFKNHVERRPKAAEGFTISPFKEFLAQAEIAVHDNMTIAALLSAVNHRLWRFAMQRNRGYYVVDS